MKKLLPAKSAGSGAWLRSAKRPAVTGATFFGRRLFGAVLGLCFLAAPARAATYYVSPSGNDNNSCATSTSTSPTSQKLTIGAAIPCLTAGDTLLIHGGTYNGDKNTIDSETFSGTFPSGANFSNWAITIGAVPGEQVILQPPDGYHAIRLTTGAPHYLIFQDLVLDGSLQNIIPANGGPDLVYLSNGAHHNRFLRLEVRNNAANGYGLSTSGSSADYNEIIGGAIHNNGRLAYGNTGYAVYLKSSNNLIQGVDIYGNNGYGVHLNTAAGAGNSNKILANKIHDNLVHGAATAGGTTAYGIVVIQGNGTLIANNLIYANQGGILLYNSAQNTLVYNNTITANVGHAGGGESGVDLQYYGAGNIIRNNIIFGNVSAIVDYGDAGGRSSNYVADTNLTSDPSFVNASGRDYRLQPGSAASDAGVTIPAVTTDYAGASRPATGYDIGAYESNAQGVSALTAPTGLIVVAMR